MSTSLVQPHTVVTAPVPAATVAPVSAPVKTDMPPYRRADFEKRVAASLRATAGKLPQEQAITGLIKEQHALAAALNDPAFQRAAAMAYLQLENIKVVAPYGITYEEAAREMQSILRNRIHDAEQFATLLTQPDFIAHVVSLAAKPAEPAPAAYSLPPAKQDELIDRMVSPYDPRGAEPAPHVGMNARGQRIGHAALAEAFAPGGPMQQPLMDALARQLPNMPKETLQQMTNDWLVARMQAAAETARQLAPDGTALQTALERSEQLQAQRIAGQPPATNADKVRASKAAGKILVDRI